MGMFDEIIVEYPLPDGLKFEGVRFQTKDFDNVMQVFTITKEGRLVFERREFQENEKAPLGFSLVGTGEIIDTEYHGVLSFYHSVGSHSNRSFIWYEYVAHFTDGQLQSIKRVEPVTY